MKLLTLAIFAVILAVVCPGCSSECKPGLYTSSRHVTGIAIVPDGSVWVSTRGGVLWKDPLGKWRKFTTSDGLPSNETLGISVQNGSVVASFPGFQAAWSDGKWESRPHKNFLNAPASICTVTWQGKRCVADVEGLKIVKGDKEQAISIPPSTGSHISALLPRGDRLWAAMFGDGLWEFDGKGWSKVEIGLPDAAREITALAGDGSSLWVGTRREWVWEYRGGKWKQHAQPDEPYSVNCQAITAYDGKVYISTLEDGLVVWDRDGWESVKAPIISSNAPRQMIEFRGMLYIRHGNGKVDSLDGDSWQKEISKDLPRKQASCIAADKECLYLGQWGGWSEFNGEKWSHHLQLPDLQGVQVTAILPEDDRMWIGTQGRGIAEIDRTTYKVTWHDERNGLPDDWIKCMVRVGDTLYAGTFVGGLAYLGESGWKSYSQLDKHEITALLEDSEVGLIAASRNGVYTFNHSGELKPFFPQDQVVTEVQALCRTSGGLWIGSRTGLLKAE